MPIILSKVYRSSVMVIVPVMLLFCLVCKWPVVMVTLSFLLKYFSSSTPVHYWLENVLSAYKNVNNDTPFLLYGYDWLAFAHFILVILFIGPCEGPVENSWVIEYRLLACLLIFRLAFIAGSLRRIPMGWRLIDCALGLLGFLSLWICHLKSKELIYKTIQSNKLWKR